MLMCTFLTSHWGYSFTRLGSHSPDMKDSPKNLSLFIIPTLVQPIKIDFLHDDLRNVHGDSNSVHLSASRISKIMLLLHTSNQPLQNPSSMKGTKCLKTVNNSLQNVHQYFVLAKYGGSQD